MFMTNKLKIGVVVNSELVNGGAFAQASAVVDQLLGDETNEYYFITNNKSTYRHLKSKAIYVQYLYGGIVRLIKDLLKGRVPSIPIKIDKFVEKFDLDLIYMIGPYDVFKNLTKCGYIFTINDLSHRDSPEFKEISRQEFKRREDVYGRGSLNSLLTLVDSECTKKKMNEYYGVDLKRILVNEFSISKGILHHNRMANKYTLKEKYGNYIYYPAQFWAHKNHAYIIEAMSILVRNYEFNWKVIFTGTDYGNKSFVTNKIKNLELEEFFVNLGFVDDDLRNELYCHSKCLAMPTWFGPTNIPPLEAFFFEIPVIYSIQGNEAGLFDEYTNLINLEDPISLVEAILKVYNNDPIIAIKQEKAKKYIDERLKNSSGHPISEYLEKYKILKKSWA